MMDFFYYCVIKQMKEYILTPDNINEPIPVETTILKCQCKGQLTELPNTLGNCINLQELYCQWNKLTKLPDTIGNCINLKKLICCFNQLTSLPNTIGNCINLQILYCHCN